MRLIFLPLMPAIIIVMALLTTNSLAYDEAPLTDGESPDAFDEMADETTGHQESLATRRAAAREHLAQLNDEQRYDEAAAVALQILRLTQEEYGDAAQQAIDPLIALAEAQHHGVETTAAEQNLSAALLLIEQYDGPLSAQLIGPLTMLGTIYNESGQYDRATQTFDRALRLNHVNHGFLNFDQFPIMDGLTDSYAAQNDLQDATFYQKSQLEIQQRKLGADNPGTAPAYYKLARWYSRNYRYDESILTYQKADRVVRTALGKNSPARAEALQGLALEYQKTGNGVAANSTLRKALRLVEESPDNDPLRRASILVALGDNLTREGKFSSAQSQYAAAWQVLPDDDIGAEHRAFYFDRRVRLEGNLFPKYARYARGHSADKLKTGSILINYSIDTRGRVKDVSVIESNPQELMDRSFLSVYRRSLFRPHYVDGSAEPSVSLLAEHEFFYIDGKAASEDDSDSDSDSKPGRGKLKYPGKD